MVYTAAGSGGFGITGLLLAWDGMVSFTAAPKFGYSWHVTELAEQQYKNTIFSINSNGNVLV